MPKYCRECMENEKECRCSYFSGMDIDYLIYPTIRELRRKGYNTEFCCSGHESSALLQFYISFYDDILEEICSDFFEYENYKYNGRTKLRRNKIRPKKEIENKYNKSNEKEKIDILQKINRDAYVWARELPLIVVNSKIINKEFDTTYYEAYVDRKKDPWLLLVKPNRDNIYYVNLLSELSEGNNKFSVAILNRNLEVFIQRSISLQNQECLLRLTSDYPVIVYGEDKKLQVETINFYGLNWLVIIPEKEKYLRLDKISHDNYIKESSISFFIHYFNNLCNEGIHFCSFATSNLVIICSDGYSFTYSIEEETLVIMGDVEEVENTDLSIVDVIQREIFVFCNNILLVREEIKSDR